ncbi:hypothetical protein ACYZT8_03205 [Pseudomonas sp. LB3P93]
MSTTWTRDRVVLGKKNAQKRLIELEAEKRLLMKITNKGGVVVIQERDALITTTTALAITEPTTPE